MAWRNVIHYCQSAAVTRGLVAPFRKHRARESPSNRRIGSYAHRCDARRIPHLLNHRTVELLAATLFIVESAQIEIHGQKIFGFKTQIGLLRVLHAMQEEPRADQRD